MSTFRVPARQVDISRSDSTPPEVPLSFNPEIVRRTVAHGAPPQLDITIQNNGREKWTYSTDYVPVFSGFVNKDAPPYLYLVPVNLGAEYSDEELQLIPGTFAPDAVQYENQLSPGQQEGNRYDVIDSPENGDQRYPQGDYRFAQQVKAISACQDNSVTFSWGFELSVSADADPNPSS